MNPKKRCNILGIHSLLRTFTSLLRNRDKRHYPKARITHVESPPTERDSNNTAHMEGAEIQPCAFWKYRRKRHNVDVQRPLPRADPRQLAKSPRPKARARVKSRTLPLPFSRYPPPWRLSHQQKKLRALPQNCSGAPVDAPARYNTSGDCSGKSSITFSPQFFFVLFSPWRRLEAAPRFLCFSKEFVTSIAPPLNSATRWEIDARYIRIGSPDSATYTPLRGPNSGWSIAIHSLYQFSRDA